MKTEPTLRRSVPLRVSIISLSPGRRPSLDHGGSISSDLNPPEHQSIHVCYLQDIHWWYFVIAIFME